MRVLRLGQLHQLQPGHTGHHNVAQHEVDRFAAQPFDRLVRRSGEPNPIVGIAVLDRPFDAASYNILVIYDQNVHCLIVLLPKG
ncbi:hypothetical protein D3C84_1000640 [compost metagenome]